VAYFVLRSRTFVDMYKNLKNVNVGGGGGELISSYLQCIFKLMHTHNFSIALLLFGIISPTMNKFVCALKKNKFWLSGKLCMHFCVTGEMVES
jgi:hypothetical protein